MWFEKLSGFTEGSAEQVRSKLSIDGTVMTSSVNGKSYTCGRLETPSLGELRQRVRDCRLPAGKIRLREEVAGVQQLHLENPGALFQVASQFNLLEMVSPDVTPEAGIDSYEFDGTQGPACAIAAGSGTIYRHYFAEVDGQVGQSAAHQIDCLADMGLALGNTDQCLWKMRNGYALASAQGLAEITSRIESLDESGIDRLREQLRIGIQWDTEVTLNDAGHLVTQAYCSALPVGYSPCSTTQWARFARLVLEASYEAVFCAAILNAAITGNNKLYLTLIGGGVFGNDIEWITDAIGRATGIHQGAGLDVVIVSYGAKNSQIRVLVERYG